MLNFFELSSRRRLRPRLQRLKHNRRAINASRAGVPPQLLLQQTPVNREGWALEGLAYGGSC